MLKNDDARVWTVFLCYRRDDASEEARALRDILQGRNIPSCGVSLSVFLDQDVGAVANWRAHHQPALERARALIFIVSSGVAADLSTPDRPDWVYRELHWWERNRGSVPPILVTIGKGDRYVPQRFRDAWRDVNRIDLDLKACAALTAADHAHYRDSLAEQLVAGIVDRAGVVSTQDLEIQRRKNRILRIAVVTASVALFVTVGLLAMLGTALATVREQEKQVQQEWRRAEGHARFMLVDLADSLEKIGRLDLLEPVARRTLQHYESVPWLETRLTVKAHAAALGRLGDVLFATGDTAAALECFGESYRLRRDLLAEYPTDAELMHNVALTWERIGDVKRATGHLASALECYETSRDIRDRIRSLPGEEEDGSFGFALCLGKIGEVHKDMGHLDSARTTHLAELGLMRQLASATPDNRRRLYGLAVSYGRLGDVEKDLGNIATALESQSECCEIAKRLVAAESNNVLYLRCLATGLERVGDIQKGQGALMPAQESYEASLGIAQRIHAWDPSNVVCQRDVSVSLEKIGDVHAQRGDWQEALQAWQDSLKMTRRIVEGDPHNASWRGDLYLGLEKVGLAQKNTGDLSAALETWRESLDVSRSLAQLDAKNAVWQRYLCMASFYLGSTLFEMRQQPEEAVSLLSESEDAHARLVDMAPHLQSEHWAWRSAHQLARANMLYESRAYEEAAQAYALALVHEPIRANLNAGHLYNGACAAALAAGVDGPKARWKRQAMEWLAEDLHRRREAATRLHAELQGEGLSDDQRAELGRTLNQVRDANAQHFEWAKNGDPDLIALRGTNEFLDLFEE
mgnify:FL=1